MSSKKEKIPAHPVEGSKWFDLQKAYYYPLGIKENDTEFYLDCPDVLNIRSLGGVFVNDAFKPLWNARSGLYFSDGGYGSSKTTYWITRLLEKCLNSDYFKCFYGRQKWKEARQLHKNIIREIKRNGWEEYFKYSEAPNGTTEIKCDLNGNTFELFGCDDDESLKGIDNPTHILVDEINQITFESFGMLITRLRTAGHDYQMIGCFNNCDVFPEHWLRVHIYKNGDEETLTKEDELILNELQKLNIEKHHSVYLDNYFLDKEDYYSKLVIKAGGDQDKIDAYCDGTWGVKLNSQPYYKGFKKEKHIKDVYYDSRYPLMFSFDENVNPYLPVLVVQVIGNDINIIDEFVFENPYNTLDYTCSKILEIYGNHNQEVYIYGDATAKKGDVKLEKGQNLFTMIMDLLETFNPILKVPSVNPNNKTRGLFANLVLSKNYDDISVNISPSCKKTIEDFQNVQEDVNGKGGKSKERKMYKGIKGVQIYGHLGDCFDYLLCERFMNTYLRFQNGAKSYEPTGGGRTVNNSMDETYESLQLKKDILKQLNPDASEEIDEFEDYIPNYNEMIYGKTKSRNSMD